MLGIGKFGTLFHKDIFHMVGYEYKILIILHENITKTQEKKPTTFFKIPCSKTGYKLLTDTDKFRVFITE